MEHSHQKSAVLFFISLAEYPHIAFLTNDSLMVNYVTYNIICLSRTVGSVDGMLRIYHFYQTFVAMLTPLQPLSFCISLVKALHATDNVQVSFQHHVLQKAIPITQPFLNSHRFHGMSNQAHLAGIPNDILPFVFSHLLRCNAPLMVKQVHRKIPSNSLAVTLVSTRFRTLISESRFTIDATPRSLHQN